MLRSLLTLCLAALGLFDCAGPAHLASMPAGEATVRPPTPVAEAAPDPSVEPRTRAAFAGIMEAARAGRVAALSYGEIVQWTGERLLGQPYVAGLLDAPPEEMLVVNLRAFDCVLYVENVLALAETIARETYAWDDYVAALEAMRYRDGRMQGYCSRLHYFSDWIADNAARGRVENVTEASGGVRFPKTLSFMSANRSAYPRLASDETFACIVAREADLRGLELFYIPQERIALAYPHLRPGDVIATTTGLGGLDVTHTGFVYRPPGGRGTGFMHASQTQREVVVSEDLARYVQGVRAQTGIIVARPLDPRTRRDR
ncbi:MAG: N-acetylmuramoyl-L-alanine amidase-like domain-containing protein [Rubricoccaceae bacterium]